MKKLKHMFMCACKSQSLAGSTRERREREKQVMMQLSNIHV
jgi:hypothetical protein